MDSSKMRWRYQIKKGDKVCYKIKIYNNHEEYYISTVTGISKKSIYVDNLRIRKDSGVITEKTYSGFYRKKIQLIKLDEMDEITIKEINDKSRKRELIKHICNKEFLENLTLDQLEKIYSKNF